VENRKYFRPKWKSTAHFKTNATHSSRSRLLYSGFW